MQTIIAKKFEEEVKQSIKKLFRGNQLIKGLIFLVKKIQIFFTKDPIKKDDV
jgi:hypothetical protein